MANENYDDRGKPSGGLDAADPASKFDFNASMGGADESKRAEDAAISGYAEDGTNKAEKAAQNKGLSGSALESTENSVGSGGLSSGFNSARSTESDAVSKLGAAALTPPGNLGRLKKLFWSTRGRKTASVAGLGVGVTGGVVGIVMLLMPTLKLPSMISMIEKRFFSNTNQIGDTVSQRLFTQYIITKLIPGMITNECVSSNVSRSCALTSNSDFYAGKLWNAWHTGNIEQDMFETDRFEITRKNGVWHLKSNTLDKNLGAYDGSEEKRAEFERGVREKLRATDARLAINELINKQTGFSGRQMRQAGAVLSAKYGIPRTLISARLADWKKEKITDPINAGRAIVIQRVIGPYNEGLALALECMMDRNFPCTSEAVNDDGFKGTKFQNDLHAAAREYATKYGEQALSDMLADSDSIKQKGLGPHLAEKLATQIAGEAGGSTIKFGTKAIPVVGWVDLAVQLMNVANKIPGAYPMIIATINTRVAVDTFATYAVASDEQKFGDTDWNAFGALTATLDASDEENGKYGAENSPVLRAANGEVVTESVVCNDGTRAEGLLCPEEKFVPDGSKWLAGGTILASLMTGGPMGEITRGIWNGTVGWVLDTFGDAIGWIIAQAPGYDQAVKSAGQIFGQIVDFFVADFIPAMVPGDASGDRMMNTAWAGGAQVGNDMCEMALGCKTVDTETYAQSSLAYLEKDKAAFEKQSVFARLFDTENSRSLINTVALNSPASVDGLRSMATSIATSNPLSSIVNNLSSSVAHAETADSYAQYFSELGFHPKGYDANDELFHTNDYEAYEANLACSSTEDPNRMKQWGETAKLDWPTVTDPESTAEVLLAVDGKVPFSYTAQYEYETTNGCLAMRSITSSLGCKYDESMCQVSFGSGAGSSQATPSLPVPGEGISKERGEELTREYTAACMGGASYPGDICGAYLNECVSFVKFVLMEYGSKYPDSRFASLGNGADVVGTLKSIGYEVNGTPAPLSVVSFPRGHDMGGWNASGFAGHVALVLAVNPDGSLLLAQSSNDTGPYVETLPAASARGLQFAHTEADIAGAAQ